MAIEKYRGICAIAVCATDLEIISHGLPAIINGDDPFNKNFTPGHEYMGTVVKLGPNVDEFKPGDRVTVEIHAGCGRCSRCREGMYTSCLNYGHPEKGHRANGFTTDGGFTHYAVNNINTLVHVPEKMSDEEATLVVTAGTAMYGLDVMGGLIAGEGVVVTGPGPIGLMGVAVAKAMGAQPVILTGTRDSRLEMGTKLGADNVFVYSSDQEKFLNNLNENYGLFDAAIVFAPVDEVTDTAIKSVKKGGTVVIATVGKIPNFLAFEEKTIRGTLIGSRKDMEDVIEISEKNNFEVVTETFPLEQANEALQKLKTSDIEARAVLIP